MEHVICVLCGQNNPTPLYTRDSLTVVLCARCGLGYLNPRMTKDEYDRHYRESYQKVRHNIDDTASAIKRLEQKKSYERQAPRLGFFEGILSPTSKVLEVGSGWGTFLKLISDTYHCPVQGIEISHLAARVAQDYYHLPVIEEPIETYAPRVAGTVRYDCIILHHVLEHFLDPVAALASVKSLLAPGGGVYIAVPNLTSPDEPLSRYFRIQHTYYFTIETLTQLLQKAGFTITKQSIAPNEIKVFVSLDQTGRGYQLSEPSIRSLQRMIRWRQRWETLKEKIKETPVGSFLLHIKRYNKH